MLCFRKVLVAKKFMDKKGGGGLSLLFVEKFFSQGAETFRRENFTLSLVSGIEKINASEGYVTISLRIFLSHSSETFHRRTLVCCVSEKFWCQKSL